MKTSLFKQKVEPEYDIEKRNVNEFLSIANEIVSNVKIGNNEYVKNNQDMKRILEQSRNEREKKLIRKKINNSNNKINNNNNNNLNINSNVNINNNTNDFSNNEWINLNKENYSNSNANNTNNLNSNINNSTNKRDNKLSTNNKKPLNDLDDQNGLRKGVSSIINRNFMSTANEGNRVNLNKISNLEAQPGKIRIRENTNILKDYANMKTDNTNSQGKFKLKNKNI